MRPLKKEILHNHNYIISNFYTEILNLIDEKYKEISLQSDVAYRRIYGNLCKYFPSIINNIHRKFLLDFVSRHGTMYPRRQE